MAGENGKNTVAENVLVVPISKILVDDNFNARFAKSIVDVASPDADEGKGTTGLAGLAESLKNEGQDTAVKLRPNPDKKTATEKPYALVAGFRRVKALLLIAGVAKNANEPHPIKGDPSWDSSNPTVKATVDEMTESEAQMLNMRENTARDDLGGADLAFGVQRLIAQYAKEKNTERGGKRAIALGLGKTEQYIGKLANIMSEMPGACLEHWRTAPKPLPVATMLDIIDEKKFPKERRKDQYEIFCKGGAGSGGAGDKDPNAWLETAKENAVKVGRLFGIAEATGELKEGVAQKIEWANIMLDGGAKSPGMVKFKKSADGNQRRQIVSAFKRGVKEGIKAVADAESAEEEEEEGEGATAN